MRVGSLAQGDEMITGIQHDMLRRVARGDIIRRHAARHPGRPALIRPAGTRPQRTWSWAEFNAATSRVPNGLRDLGVGKGDKVGVPSLNSPEFVVLVFAVMKMGAVIAPVSAAPRNDERVCVIRHCDARIVFVQEPAAWRRRSRGEGPCGHCALDTSRRPGPGRRRAAAAHRRRRRPGSAARRRWRNPASRASGVRGLPQGRGEDAGGAARRLAAYGRSRAHR